MNGFFQIDVNGTFGVGFVGFTLSTILFGILSAQVYAYYCRYPHDRPVYKFVVLFLWILEALHSALTGHSFYTYIISNWGNPLSFIERPLWSMVIQIAVGGFIGSVVKSCYAVRVWRFSKGNLWITSVIMLSIFVQYGFALWYTVIAYRLPSLVDISSITAAPNVALGLGALTEIFIAGALCWYLRKLRTGSPRSDPLINRLTLYAVNTGVLTSAFSLMSLITYDTMPHNFVFISSYFIQSKLYANSLLATLNMRQPLKGQGMDDEQGTPVFRLVDRPHARNPNSDPDLKSNVPSGGICVGVHREVSVRSDMRQDEMTKDSHYTSDW